MKNTTKILITVLFTLSITFSVFTQTEDEKNALAVVNKMFTEMANYNPTAIAELYTKDSNLTAIIKGKDGKNRIIAATGEDFSKNFAEKRGEIKEDMYAPEVKVYDDLAVIHGRYVFFVNGQISHCGTNAFHLVKTETGWLIANASSTIDPAACTEAEKARKAN
jgi:hypothetical protein